MSPHPQGKGLPLGALERSPSRNREEMQSPERIVGTCAWAADAKGLRLAVQEGVVFQAAAKVAAGARIVNVVHYFFRGGHGNDWKHDREAVKWEYDREAVKWKHDREAVNTEEFPQRSETPGLG